LGGALKFNSMEVLPKLNPKDPEDFMIPVPKLDEEFISDRGRGDASEISKEEKSYELYLLDATLSRPQVIDNLEETDHKLVDAVLVDS
jgi:hypothetical protein